MLASAILTLALGAAAALGVVDRLALTSLEPRATAAQPAAAGIVAAPNSAQDTAVQQVIQQGNAEQAQAITAHDASAMADTATEAYFQQLRQVNEDLLSQGVVSIALVSVEWGPITVDGTTATATTYETWTTTYADGTTEQSRDRNEYRLVQQNGSWKIAADDHPRAGGGNSGASSSGAAPAPRPAAPSSPSSPGSASGPTSSRNWAGYAATGGPYTAVSGTWTVPPFSASSPAGADATWVGIGGVTSRDLIQAGTQEQTSGAGETEYQAWIETLPSASKPVPLAIHAGDSVTVAITEQAQNSWLISFADNTTGQSYQETEQYASSRSSAEWIEEAPSTLRGGELPLDSFGAVSFTGGSAVERGQRESIAAAGAQPITMLAANLQALAVPSALGTDGTSFRVTRTSAPSAQPGGRAFPGGFGG